MEDSSETGLSDILNESVKFNQSTTEGIKKKADHNKNESQYCFLGIIGCTLLAPLFVTLGEGNIFGKIVPALMSVTAAGLTTWLQVRKPQKLWALYRRAQRELENEHQKCTHNLPPYDISNKAKLLAEKTNQIAWGLHEKWEGLVPEPDAIGASISPNLSPLTKLNDK